MGLATVTLLQRVGPMMGQPCDGIATRGVIELDRDDLAPVLRTDAQLGFIRHEDVAGIGVVGGVDVTDGRLVGRCGQLREDIRLRVDCYEEH